MKVVALISGGKDSCFNMMHAVAEGHEIVALANLYPDEKGKDELDSYMYQTVGHEAIDLYSQAMDLPLFRRKIIGSANCMDLNYVPNSDDEVEDLYILLQDIKKYVSFDAVASGAILSDYQRIRVESVCRRLGLTSLSFLWRRNQEELFQEMIACHLKAILIKTAALGLEPRRHLGKTLSEMSSTLYALSSKYGCHVCGEGGEFETFTLDCPLFKKEIVIDESEIVIHSDDYSAPVGYLKLKKMHLEAKNPANLTSIHDLPLLTSKKWASQYNLKKKSDQEIATKPTPTKIQWTKRVSSSSNEAPGISNCGNFVTISNLQGTTESAVDAAAVGKVTWDALTKVEEILKNFNHDMEDVCYVQMNVSDMSHYKHINMIYSQFFEHNPPARACIGCIENKYLEDEKVLFQLYCISYRGKQSRKVLHVQGISHWAPANIGDMTGQIRHIDTFSFTCDTLLGPFSQCISQNGLLFVSGTIALVPGVMELIESNAETQAKLALDHVQSITQAMGDAASQNFTQCICYVTEAIDIASAMKAWRAAVGSGIPRSCQPLYVVVNELPKSAKIEWQGIAFRTDESLSVSLGSDSQCHRGLRSQWYSVEISGDDRIIYSFVASLVPLESCQELDLDECIIRTQEVLHSWLDSHRCSISNVVQASLFSAGVGSDIASLQDAWSTAANDCSRVNVTPTGVHALFHGKDYCAIALMCYIIADL